MKINNPCKFGLPLLFKRKDLMEEIISFVIVLTILLIIANKKDPN